VNKRMMLEIMLSNAKQNAEGLQAMIDELPAPKLQVADCNCGWRRGVQCPVCGGLFSTKDSLVKEIPNPGDPDYPFTMRLIDEEGRPVCDDCGDRYASDLIKDMRDERKAAWIAFEADMALRSEYERTAYPSWVRLHEAHD
jgi:hypothetical protein